MCIVNMLLSTEYKVVIKSTLYFSSTWHQKVHALSLSPLDTEAKPKGAFAVQVQLHLHGFNYHVTEDFFEERDKNLEPF